MDRKDGASCDPGWNDPPLFTYESQTAQSKNSKPRSLLNKRVAFPLHEASPPKSFNAMLVDPTAPLPTCTRSTLPPPPLSTLTPSQVIPTDGNGKTETEGTFDPLQVLESVMDNLKSILIIMFEKEEKDKIDIERRLDTMKRMWIENKFSKDIQQKLLTLSLALKENEIEKADDIQKGLMVDYGSVCSPWMSGVRHLIHQHHPQIYKEVVEEGQAIQVTNS